MYAFSVTDKFHDAIRQQDIQIANVKLLMKYFPCASAILKFILHCRMTWLILRKPHKNHQIFIYNYFNFIKVFFPKNTKIINRLELVYILF